MSNELAVLPTQMIDVSDSALSVEHVVKQRSLITDCMAKAMKEDQHYGKVPGCGDKPTLLQPGAQLLAHLFRLRPEYEIIETDLPASHKRFRVTCRLFFIGSIPEIKIAEGVGESSSMESKHRFRNAAPIIEPTEDVVPKAYWQWREQLGDAEARKRLAEAYDGQNVGPKKIDGQWKIVIYKGGGGDEKVENPNPADVFNTVLKIAKKRAFVDATITATASSDFFTQDLEDIRDNLAAVETASAKASGTNGDGPKNAPEQKPASRQRKSTVKPPPSPAKGKDDEIPMCNGEHHKNLAGLLDFNSKSQEDFMEWARSVNLIPQNKMTFGQMPDEMAAKFTEDLESVLTGMEAKK